MQALINAVAEKYNGVISNGFVKFTCGDADFCFTDGVMYQECDGKFSPGFQRVRTLAAVDRFVDLRK